MLATLSTTRTDSLVEGGDSTAAALTGGYHLAFAIGAGLVIVAVALGVSLLRPGDGMEAAQVEPAPEEARAELATAQPSYSEEAA